MTCTTLSGSRTLARLLATLVGLAAIPGADPGLSRQDERLELSVGPALDIVFRLEGRSLVDPGRFTNSGDDPHCYVLRLALPAPETDVVITVTSPLGECHGENGGSTLLELWRSSDAEFSRPADGQATAAIMGRMSLRSMPPGRTVYLDLMCHRKAARQRGLDDSFEIPVQIHVQEGTDESVPEPGPSDLHQQRSDRVERLRTWKPARPLLLERALRKLAEIQTKAGDHAAALRSHEEAQDLLRRHGSQFVIALAVGAGDLGLAALRSGETDLALTAFEERLGIAVSGNDQLGEGSQWHQWEALKGIAEARHARGEIAEALEATQRLHKLADEGFSIGPENYVPIEIAYRYLTLGAMEDAARALRTAPSPGTEKFTNRGPNGSLPLAFAQIALDCGHQELLETQLDALAARPLEQEWRSRFYGEEAARFVEDASGRTGSPKLFEFALVVQRTWVALAEGRISKSLADFCLVAAREGLRWGRVGTVRELCRTALEGFPRGSENAVEAHLLWALASSHLGLAGELEEHLGAALRAPSVLERLSLLSLAEALDGLRQLEEAGADHAGELLAELAGRAKQDERVRQLLVGWPRAATARGEDSSAAVIADLCVREELLSTQSEAQGVLLVRACLALRSEDVSLSGELLREVESAEEAAHGSAFSAEAAFLRGIAAARAEDWGRAKRAFRSAVDASLVAPFDSQALSSPDDLRVRLARLRQYGDAFLATLVRQEEGQLSIEDLDPLVQLQDLAGLVAVSGRRRWTSPIEEDGSSLYARWASLRSDPGLGGEGSDPSQAEERARLERELTVRVISSLPRLEEAGSLSDLPSSTSLLLLRLVDPSPWIVQDWVPYAPTDAPSIKRYVAVVLPKGSTIAHAKDLGPAAEIDATITGYLANVIKVDAARGFGVTGATREENALPAAELWSRLDDLLGKAKRVTVIPDGIFDGFPLGVLPAGDDKFAIESTQFITLDGGWQLRDFNERFPKKPGPALLVGGVAFGGSGTGPAAAGALASNGGSFAPLPGSLEEVQAIEAAMEARSSRVKEAQLLTDRDATKAEVRSAWKGKSILHLATHGYFYDVSSHAEMPASVPPGIAAGLVLAPGATGDSFLTADEIAAANGDGWELIVLSACHTARGRVVPGEGLASLRRAFHLAGAKRVISTAWAVPDEATSTLMEKFYDELLGGDHPADALHAAQLSILRAKRKGKIEGGAPSDWAGFMLSGRFR